MRKNFSKIVLSFVVATLPLFFANDKEYVKAKASGFEETITADNFCVEYASSGSSEVTANHGKYKYGIRHGRVLDTMSEFDNITYSNGGCVLKQTSDGDNQYAAIPWKTCFASANGDGVILYFTALTDLNFTSNAVTYGGWPTSAYVSYYKQKTNGTILTLSSTMITSAANSVYEDALPTTRVKTGETIYYEFRYDGIQSSGNRRSIQTTVPSFTFDDNEPTPWSDTLNTKDLAIEYGKTVAADSEADYTCSENNKYVYGIRHGDLSRGIVSKFDKVTSTSNSANFVMEEDESNKMYANVIHWAMYSSNGDGYSFFFRALEDISFSASDGSYGGNPVSGYLNFYLKLSNSNKYLLLYSKLFTAEDKTAPFATINLHEGEEIYWEFISYGNNTGANRLNIQRNAGLDFYPTFVVGSPSDLADYYDGEENTYSSYFDSALTNLKKSGEATTSKGLLDISFNHGSPRSYTMMSLYSGSTMIAHSTKQLAKFSSEQAQANANDDAIIKYRAKANISLGLQWSTDNANGIASSGSDSVIRYYVESANGDLYLLDERDIVLLNQGKNGEYDISISLKSDESLLISIGSDVDALQIVYFTPAVSTSLENYNVANAIDFTSINELSTYKTTKMNGLHWWLSSYNNVSLSTVLIEHFTYCNDIEVKYLRLIKSAESKGQVDSFVNQYKAELKNVSDAAKFVYSYLHMRDYDIYWDNTNGSNLCLTYYGDARTAFNNLSSEARSVVCENERFVEAYERLTSWTSANNDYFDAEYSIKSKMPVKNIDNNGSYVLAIFVSIFSLLILGVFIAFIRKQRREK